MKEMQWDGVICDNEETNGLTDVRELLDKFRGGVDEIRERDLDERVRSVSRLRNLGVGSVDDRWGVGEDRHGGE